MARLLTLRIVGVGFLTLTVIALGFWGYFSLRATDIPGTGVDYSYTTNEAAVMTALADSLAASPEVNAVLTNSSCPSSGPDYNIDPATVVSGLLGLLGISGEDGCYQVTGDITIFPRVYWMNLSKAILVIRATGTITIRYYDQNCKIQTETIELSSLELAFSIKNDGSIGGIVPLPGGKPICVIRLPSRNIQISHGSLDRDKCPHCVKGVPVEDPPLL